MGKRSFAVFDIDGTLYRGTFFLQCVQRLIARGIIPANYQEQIELYRRAWQQREHPEAYRDFSMFLVQIWSQHAKGIPASELDAVAQELVADEKHRVYCYTRDLLAHCKAQGMLTIAISGSFYEMVKPFAAHYGFDVSVGEENQRDGDVLSGEVNQRTYADKHVILQRLIDKFDLTPQGSYAVGDTHNDSSMLAMVEHPIAFNPNQALFDEARQRGWKVVVERKNVIYELEPDGHGTFLLAAPKR